VNVVTLWDCDLTRGKFPVIAVNSKNYTNVGKVAFSHNKTFLLKSFTAHVSADVDTKEMLSCRAPYVVLHSACLRLTLHLARS
jgi:hypothetical protein